MTSEIGYFTESIEEMTSELRLKNGHEVQQGRVAAKKSTQYLVHQWCCRRGNSCWAKAEVSFILLHLGLSRPRPWGSGSQEQLFHVEGAKEQDWTVSETRRQPWADGAELDGERRDFRCGRRPSFRGSSGRLPGDLGWPRGRCRRRGCADFPGCGAFAEDGVRSTGEEPFSDGRPPTCAEAAFLCERARWHWLRL